MLLAEQLVDQRSVHSNPLVLGATPLKTPAPAVDRDQPVSQRFEPNSRTTLIGEQPNPWKLLHLQDVMSRHRVSLLLLIVWTISSPGPILIGLRGWHIMTV